MGTAGAELKNTLMPMVLDFFLPSKGKTKRCRVFFFSMENNNDPVINMNILTFLVPYIVRNYVSWKFSESATSVNPEHYCHIYNLYCSQLLYQILLLVGLIYMIHNYTDIVIYTVQLGELIRIF